MAYKVRKTEHSGPKKGSGAYWGPKMNAKRESNRQRRRDATNAARESSVALGDSCASP